MNFWQELRRRRVIRVAIVYAITAWLLVQITAIIFPIFDIPEWASRLVIILLTIGFPIALILTWGFELTPDGMRRTQPVEAGGSQVVAPGRSRLDYVIIGLVVIALGWLLYRTEIDRPDTDFKEVPAVSQNAAPQILHNSIAVLPFDNLSTDPDDAFFAAGIHEELLNQLAKIRDISVIARTSVLQYEGVRRPVEEIASELNVQTVMEGSVRYAGDRVRVTAQLIDGKTGAHLWSEAYDRELSDIFAIQSDIALHITDAVKARITFEERDSITRPPTDNPEALALYLRALTLADADLPLGPVLDLLGRAIDLDPDFALAYASRAFLSSSTFPYPDARHDPETVAETRARAQADAQRALELDPSQARAWLALATLARMDFRFADDVKLTERAFELSPNDTWTISALELVRFIQGRYHEVLNLNDRLMEIDPANPFWSSSRRTFAHFSQDYETAVEAAQRAVSLAPSYWYPNLDLGMTQAELGNIEAAVKSADKAFSLVVGHANYTAYSRLATIYGLAGQADKAREMIGLLQATAEEHYVPAEDFVMAHLGANDDIRAREWFLTALKKRECWVVCWLMIAAPEHPLFDPLSDTPEFRDMVRKAQAVTRGQSSGPKSN